MTEHEDLIAKAREHTQLADQRRVSAHEVRKCRLEQRQLFAKLADALEKVTAERDALAAVVEQVRQYADQIDPSNLDEQPMWPVEVRKILDEAPSVALDLVKAEALREAADERDQLAGDSDVISRWLRDRADRIEKGESNE